MVLLTIETKMTTSLSKALKKISYLGLTFTSLVLSPESFGEGRFDENENIKPLIKLAVAKNDAPKNIKKN